MTKDKRTGQQLWEKAKSIIPGGTSLLSKQSEMFLPKNWPSYFKKAQGVVITDLDERRLIDMSYMGIGACVLGYADKDVNQAVKQVIDSGSMSTLNSPEEVTLAHLLLQLHPWAQSVRYARTGGEAMAIAIRIARASTQRDVVAFCGYHGWHDWYLAANLEDDSHLDGQLLPGLKPLGVPRCLKGSALPFHYNRLDELKNIIKKHAIATIVMEPQREHSPDTHFLKEVRHLADKARAVLIFDEVTSGFRINLGGIHLTHKIFPDIAVFGKAISNGFPMAAIVGVKKIMDVSQDTFISSTYWTERIGPAAAIATIKKMKQCRVQKHLIAMGQHLMNGWRKRAYAHGLKIELLNIPPLATFRFNYGKDNQAIYTLFTQEMLKHNYLAAKSVYLSFAHTKKNINKYLQTLDTVFPLLKKAIDTKSIYDRLDGPVVHSGFARLT